ncbi:MAG: hypothetical protein ACTSYI_06350 [Promethearchaeota archaeon]
MNGTPKYYGQLFPTDIPQEFAPGIVSSDQHEHSAPTISLDGKECYWSMINKPLGEAPQKIMCSSFEDEKWTTPQPASFSSFYVDGGPVFSFDNQHLYFYSKRPFEALSNGSNETKVVNAEQQRIWVVDRVGNGIKKEWSEPHLAFGEKHANLVQFSFSIAKSGTFYFLGIMKGVKNNMGIYRIQQKDGIFGAPEPLPPQINGPHQDWIPFIAPDESYMIFSSDRPGSIGFFDLYISFHSEDESWSKPLNLGPSINTEGSERFPGLTPDGKAFFFVRESELYWIDSSFINKLRQNQ